jgi:hypothetical protein
MPIKVYLCDTSSELAGLRPALVEQAQKAGMIPVWLSDEEKQSRDLVNRVRQRATQADAFICIVTFRRGWEPNDQGARSLSEIELEILQELGKPGVIFLPDSTSELGRYLRMRAVGQETAAAERQQAFWQAVTNAGAVHTFTDEADLTTQIARVLNQWVATLGAGRSAQAAAPPILPREPAFFPTNGLSIDDFAERVADKTAARIDALQQQRQNDLAEQALKYREALALQPGELVFGRPAKRSQFQSDIFMIMSFKPEFEGIYKDIVRPLVKDLNLTITRGDEFNSTQGVIMNDVWSALNHCKFVIAEITGGNDNVFYELGIAHTLNKPAMLITQAKTPDEIPFDIRHLRYLKYENTVSGGIQLREALKTAITRLMRDLEEGWETNA